MSYFINPFISLQFPYLNYRLWGLLDNMLIMLALTFQWPIVCLFMPIVSGSMYYIYLWQLYIDHKFTKSWIFRNLYFKSLKYLNHLSLFVCTYYSKEKSLDTVYKSHRSIVDGWSIILVISGYILMTSHIIELVVFSIYKF